MLTYEQFENIKPGTLLWRENDRASRQLCLILSNDGEIIRLFNLKFKEEQLTAPYHSSYYEPVE